MLYDEVPPDQRVTDAWLRTQYPKATASWVAWRLTGGGCAGATAWTEHGPRGRVKVVRYGRCKRRATDDQPCCAAHRSAEEDRRAHQTRTQTKIVLCERRRDRALAAMANYKARADRIARELDRLYAELKGQQRLHLPLQLEQGKRR